MATNLSHPLRDHERRDADPRWIFGLVLFLFVSGLVIQAILLAYLGSLKRAAAPTDLWRPAARAAPSQSQAAPFPRLQLSPPLDLKAFQAREEAELNTYGWINRTAGVVRLPIERAMELVLQQGLPVRANSNASQTGPSPMQLIQQRSEHREREIQGEQ